MSSVVDQRVVELKFDNKQFEANVKTSLETLEKLKQGLDLNGAVKGLENIDSASKKIDMSKLSDSVETIYTKFSKLDVIGVTALANIANSAVNAGKKLLSSLTVDPIRTGFQEYETQINSVQTILANTQNQQAKVSKQAIASIEESALAAAEESKQANAAALEDFKKTQSKAIDNLKKSQEEAVDAMRDTHEQALDDLRERQNDELEMYEETSDDEISILDDKYEKMSDALQNANDAELESIKKLHDEKLKMYSEEYMEKLKINDEEKYNALKAVEDEIAAIENKTKAEDEARKKEQQNKKLNKLRENVQNADDPEERKRATEELKEFEEEIARERVLKEREAEIEALESKKDSINEEYDLKEDQITQEYVDKTSKEQEFHNLNIENIEKEHSEKGAALQSEYETEKALLLKNIDEGREAIKDRHDEEIENLQKIQNAEMDDLKERQSSELDAIKERQDNELKALNANHQVALSNIEARKKAEIKALNDAAKANVKSSTLEDVNQALDELNRYADQTIYNFTEMTRNIGTFTAAGVDLDTSVQAIKGIANLAAISGSNSQQASTAMYQLSQALASGTVKLQDWNSVVNAGMGGQVFQNALMETARVHGIAIDEMIAEEGSFRETLQKGWLSSDILTETLSKFTGDLSREQLKSIGYTEEQIDGIIDLGNTANEAATKVKTFTQLFDTTKEAAQSGWTKTWQIIIGDFYEARDVLTKISETLNGFIGKMSDIRNNFLGGALSSKWEQLVVKINEAGVSTDSFVTTLKDVAKTHKIDVDALVKEYGSLNKAVTAGKVPTEIIIETIKKFAGTNYETAVAVEAIASNMEKYGKTVDAVINGDFGNGEKRVTALTNAGYNYAEVQDLVNKKLGSSVRHFSSLSDEQARNAEELSKLSDEQLKNKGYTEEQIIAIKDLAAAAEKAGTPINDLINSMTEPSGRDLIIETFSNSFKGLTQVLSTVSQAWKDAFEPITSQQLYDVIENVRDLSTHLIMNDEELKDLKRTLDGVFALLDIITTLTGGPLKIALKILGTLLGNANLNILDLTAIVGDAIVKVRDTMDATLDFGEALNIIIPFLNNATEGVKTWIDSFKDSDNIPRDIVHGLINGFAEGIKLVAQISAELGTAILENLKNVLGIHSPSKRTYEVAIDCILGIINGIKEWTPKVTNTIKEFGLKMVDAFRNISTGDIISVGVGIGALVIIKEIASALKKAFDLMYSLGEVLEGAAEVERKFGKVLDSVSGVLKSFSASMKAKIIKDIAISIAILAGSLALLAYIPADQLWEAILIIGALSVILGVLVASVQGMSIKSAKDGAGDTDFGKLALMLLGISASLLVMSNAVQKLGKMTSQQVTQGFSQLLGLLGVIMFICISYGTFVKGKAAQNVEKAGNLFYKIAGSLILLAIVMKIMGNLSEKECEQGGVAMVTFAGFIAAMIWATKLAGRHIDKVGNTLLSIAASMGIMVGVVKLVGILSVTDMLKGLAAMVVFGVFVRAMTKIVTGPGKEVYQVGGVLLAIASAMAILSVTAKIIATMGFLNGEMAKAAVGIAFLTVIMKVLIKAVASVGNKAPKIAATLLSISISMAIIAGISLIMGLIDLPNLAKGVGAITILGLMMAAMIWASRGAENIKGNIITMTAAIAVMATAIGILSSSAVDSTKLKIATGCLAILMGIFAIIAYNLKKMDISTTTMLSLYMLIGVVALLSYVIHQLALLPFESVLGASASLSMLLISLSASMVILQKGNLSVEAIKGAAIAAVGLVVFLGIIITAIGLLGFVSELIGANKYLTDGGNTLVIVGQAIGNFVSSMVNGLASAKSIDDSILKGVLCLSAALITLTTAQLVNGITSFMTMGVGGFSGLGNELAEFMNKAKGFFDNVGSIDTGAMQGIKFLAEAILALTTAELLDGVARFLTFGSGKASLESFGEQLVTFGANIKEFVNRLGDFSSKQVESVKFASEALMHIAKAAKELPNEGGLLGKIFGDNQIDIFSGYLPGLGTNLKSFVSNLGTFTEKQVETVTCACNALTSVARAAKALPNEGGLLAKIFGDNEIDVFSGYLPDLGANINSFASNLGTFTEKQATTIACACNALQQIVDVAKILPNEGGSLAKIFGDNDIGTFGQYLPSLGTSLNMFASNLGAFTEKQVESISYAIRAINAFARLAESNEDSSVEDMSKFGGILVEFSKKLAEFCENMSEVDSSTLTLATMNMNSLVTAIQKLQGVDFEVAERFKKAINTLAKAGVKEFVDTFNSVPSQMNVKNGAAKLIDKAIEGIESKTNNLKSAFERLVSESLLAINNEPNRDKYRKAAIQLIVEMTTGVKNSSESFLTTISSLITSSVLTITSEVNYSNYFNAGASLISKAIEGVNSNSGNFKMAFSNILGNSLSSFSDENYLKSIYNSGVTFVNKLIDGVNYKKSALLLAFSNLTANVVSTINSKTYYDKFKRAGSYLAEGFIKGVDEKISDVKTTSGLMAQASIDAAKKELDEHSPSKEFYNIGDNAGQGFVNGLGDFVSKARDKGSEIASSAKDGLSKVMATVGDSVNMDSFNGLTEAMANMKDSMDVSSFNGVSEAMANMKDSMDVTSIDGMTESMTKMNESFDVTSIDGMTESMNKMNNVFNSDSAKGMTDAASKLTDTINNDMNMNPTIRPVVDLTDVNKGVNEMNGMFSSNNQFGLTGAMPFNGMFSATKSTELANATNFEMNQSMLDRQNGLVISSDNSDVVSAIGNLRGDMGNLTKQITNLQVVLDSKALVGYIAPQMDKALGARYEFYKRGL